MKLTEADKESFLERFTELVADAKDILNTEEIGSDEHFKKVMEIYTPALKELKAAETTGTLGISNEKSDPADVKRLDDKIKAIEMAINPPVITEGIDRTIGSCRKRV